MKKLFLYSGLLLYSSILPLLAQNLMVIHRNSGPQIQLPLESIDSIRFIDSPPPIRQKIFQYNGNVLEFPLSELDSITYTIPDSASLPLVSTQQVLGLSPYSVNVNGIVQSGGTSTVIKRGFCWSTHPSPSLADSFFVITNFTGNSFSGNISGLQNGVLYYVCAFATNAAGTSYGSRVSFNTPAPLFSAGAGVTDSDGNVYSSIILNGQEWMSENLLTSKFRNGDVIPTNLNNADWQNSTSAAYAIYGNDASNNAIYGKLYNWYAVADPRGLCPTGWHVPTDAEWTSLENFIDPSVSNHPTGMGFRGTDAGMKLKAVSPLWTPGSLLNSNLSGFTALPAGRRDNNGVFYNVGLYSYFWTSTETNSTTAWFRFLSFAYNSSNRSFLDKIGGFAIRCLKD
jgi:uncharacterized protein (TIGR02145 family)